MSVPVQATTFHTHEWQSYLDNFVSPEGRVIDTANGNISHSEGQGYGLILSVLADDRPNFERILSFTSTELLVRADGLAAWRWEPDAKPHVRDSNNATDGDMLIAYGLQLAGEKWGDEALIKRAATMVGTIGATMLVPTEAGMAILPGQYGFLPEDGSGAIVNPSYWIFETFPAFARIDASANWDAVQKTGLELMRRAAVTKTGLPGDWVQFHKGGIINAPKLPAEFGYNNIRIPLYMMRAGIDPAYLGPFRRNATSQGLFRISTATGEILEPIAEPGYRLIATAMECLVTGTPVPEDLRQLAATSYYAATMQLLLLDYLRREQPHCIGGLS